MLSAIKHVADDSFTLQQDSAPVHYEHNTVQLHSGKSSFLRYGHQQTTAEPLS